MDLSPDQVVYWRWGVFVLNATIVHTWIAMAVLLAAAWSVGRALRTVPAAASDAAGDPTHDPTDDTTALLPHSRLQSGLEALVQGIRDQIEEVAPGESGRLLPFLGTLFLLIFTANVLAIVPFYAPPTGSLSTTSALAICVFFAVPAFGIARTGILEYLRNYLRPSPLMLPFHVIGELSRTVALAVRLFGNMMSGSLLSGLLLALTPLFLPIALQALGLLTGVVQAYVFAILALIYIASGVRQSGGSTERRPEPSPPSPSLR
jgi:F-type H+-transporting ATPase subunit a